MGKYIKGGGGGGGGEGGEGIMKRKRRWEVDYDGVIH